MNALVTQQLAAFKDNLAEIDLRPAKKKNLTAYDVVTIASMIEREAQVPRERRLIAAVIYNRLHQGMPLGIDATIRFATHNWTRPLRVSDLNRDGPYNTRLRRGLPPTPIGNPGLASLKAAAQPGEGVLPLLRRQAGDLRRARVLLDRRQVPARRRRLPAGPEEERRQVAHEMPVIGPGPCRA